MSTKMQKRPPKSLRNEMFIFGLRSISDDWLSNLSNEHQPNYKKGPLSHQNEMSVFGIHSISDDWPSDPSDECGPKCKKKAP